MSACILGAGHGASPRGGQWPRRGYIYLVMASFGTARAGVGLRPVGGTGGRIMGFAGNSARLEHTALCGGLCACILMLLGAGSKAGLVPFACLAAGSPIRAAPQPRFRTDERAVMTKVANLRLHSRRIRSVGTAGVAGGLRSSSFSAASSPAVMGDPVMRMEDKGPPSACSPTLLIEKRRQSSSRASVLRLAFQANGLKTACGARLHGGAVSCAQTIRCSRACCFFGARRRP